MADAFLHRRSIFDKHKDSYSFKNPIKQMRVSRSWNNPITRHKREKSLHDWASSFAGKRHYRKLSRHNALHLHEEVESLGIPAVYSGSTLTLADGSVVTGISPGIRGKCNVTINTVREGDFIRLIPDWDEQGNFFDREVHSRYELDYTNHGTKYDHSIAYLNDLGALAHHEAFHLCEEHMSYDIKDLRDKLCTYLKNEVEKVDLDYDVKKLEDSPYPSLAITSKPDDGHYYLEGYLVELKPSDVRFKYQYYGHPHEEVVIVGDDAQDLDVIAKYLFAQVEPKVAEEASLSNQEIVDAIKKADAATQSDERTFDIDIDDKGNRVDVWLKSKETGKDIWNPSWGVVTGVKKIATYDTDENGSADIVGDDPYGSAEDITAFFVKAFNDKAGVKGEAYGGARFGKYDIVQALAKALHNDEDDKYGIRYFDSGKMGIEPGYAYASNKEGEDAWKVLDDGTVEFEFAGKPQGKTKVDSLSELESAILKLFGLQLGSNGEAQEAKSNESAEETPRFVQINTQQDYNTYVRPRLRSPRKHKWTEAEGMWWWTDKDAESAKTMSEILAVDKDARFAKLESTAPGSWEVKIVGMPAKEFAGDLLDYFMGTEKPEPEKPRRNKPRSYPGGAYTVAYIDDRIHHPDDVDIYKPNAKDLLGLFKHVCKMSGYNGYEIKSELEDRTGSPDGEGLTANDVENLLADLNVGIVRVKGPDFDWSFDDKYDKLIESCQGKSESVKKNFRFKDPKSDDDLIAIQDIVYEINRRNEGQDVAEKVGKELESLMESASSDPKWNEMSDEECASAMFKAAQPILSKITSEQLEEIFFNPGHDHEYFRDAIEYDEEAEEPEYRSDDLYDFSSIRRESKNEWLDPEGEAVLKKQAPKLIDALNAEFERIGSPARLGLANNDVHFSDGYYLPVKCSGKWDEESRMLNARLDGKTLNGVKYYDGNIYLEKGWRPTSFRGARWLALHEKLAKMGSPKHEAASRIVADNKLGKIVKARQRDNVLAFLPIDDDGKNDDCTYFFKVDGNDIITKGYHWGRDEIDRSMIADDGYPWTAEPNRPTRDYVHTAKYAKQLVDRVRKCLDLGVVAQEGKSSERMGSVSFADLGADPTDTTAAHGRLENELHSFERTIWDKYDTDADYIKLRLSIHRKGDQSDKPLYTVRYKVGEEKPWQLCKGNRGALIGSFETAKQLSKDFAKMGEAATESYHDDVILQILDQSNNTYSREDLEGKTVAELEEIYSELINLAAMKSEGASAPYIQRYVITGGTGPDSGEESERGKINVSGDPEQELWDMVLKEIPADYEQHLFVNNDEFDNLTSDDDIAALKDAGLDSFKKKHGIAKITSMGYYTHPWSGMTSDLMDYRIKGGVSEAVEGLTSRDVQAAARSAWSSSGAKDFKLDIVRLGDHIIIYAKGPNGEDSVGISWHVHIPSILNNYKTPHVEQFAVDSKGNWPKEPERTFDAKDLDELENQFADEFKSLQETLDIAKENS